MDLFGRKAKLELARAEAAIEYALAWIADLEARFDKSEAQRIVLQGALDRFKNENTDLKRKCDELQREFDRVPRRMSATPLYKSEEEEELEFALRNGDIDLKEFQELLKQSGYDNSEIEIPERPERPIVY